MPTRQANPTRPLSPAPSSGGAKPASIQATPKTREYGTPGRISRMTVRGDEIYLNMRTGRGAIQYMYVHLSTQHANYNALYSLLLSCWINGAAIYATVRDRLDTAVPANPDQVQIKHADLVDAQVGEYAESQADW